MGFISSVRTCSLSLYRRVNFRHKPNCMRSINDAGIALIKEFEGFSAHAYNTDGRWTCGYGHTSKVCETTTCSPDLALAWLKEDLEIAESLVSHYVSVPLSDNQFSALVSFMFNVGLVDFRSSTLLKLINLGSWDQAADEFARWDKVNGIPSDGVLRRRLAEKELFLA